MQPMIMIVVLAMLGEVVIEALKPLLRPAVAPLAKYENLDPYLYISTAFGMLLSLMYGADMLLAVGLPELTGGYVYVGQIATGLVVGRGANAVHDAITLLSTRRDWPSAGD
jgi:hypothetical protein